MKENKVIKKFNVKIISNKKKYQLKERGSNLIE